MDAAPAIRVLAEGLGLPEGPRWHGGRLVVSDIIGRQVVAIDAAGGKTVLAEVPGQPSGLGWLPDGRMVVVSMADRMLLVQDGLAMVPAVDLSPCGTDRCNDMVVDGLGRCWIGDYPVADGQTAQERLANAGGANIILVDFSTGSPAPPRVVATGLRIPNGMAITPDGRTLIVAETAGYRLTAFTIAADGSLSEQRLWAKLEIAPDGICLDADGHIWTGTPYPPAEFQRIAEGGAVLQRISGDGAGCFACMLGGPGRHDLYLLEAPFPPDPARREGRVRVMAAPSPGAGLP